MSEEEYHNISAVKASDQFIEQVLPFMEKPTEEDTICDYPGEVTIENQHNEVPENNESSQNPEYSECVPENPEPIDDKSIEEEKEIPSNDGESK